MSIQETVVPSADVAINTIEEKDLEVKLETNIETNIDPQSPPIEEESHTQESYSNQDKLFSHLDNMDTPTVSQPSKENSILDAQLAFLKEKESPKVNCFVKTISQKVEVKDVLSVSVYYDQDNTDNSDGNIEKQDTHHSNLVANTILPENSANSQATTDSLDAAIDELEEKMADNFTFNQQQENLLDTDSDNEQTININPKETDNMQTATSDAKTLDFQAALDAVNLKKPEDKSKPKIDLDSIRSDLNKAQSGTESSATTQTTTQTTTSSVADKESADEEKKKSEEWYKMTTAYIKDKKEQIGEKITDKITSTRETLSQSRVKQSTSADEIEVENLFMGVTHAVGNGLGNILSVGKYAKIGVTEGAKDTKTIFNAAVAKFKS